MAEDRKLPIMANRGQTPYIPTGYEGLEQGVQRKRRIADALMQQGLAGPGAGARSWAQLLGSLAQTWAGKSIQKDADKEEQEINAKRQAEVQEAITSFKTDLASGATPGRIMQKYSGNPWTKELLKPYEDAMAADLKNKQEYGAPTEMLGPDGKSFVTAQVNKAGDIRQAPGGFALPPKVEIVNGVAVAPQRMTPGTVAPQPAMDAVIVGPDGKFKKNPLAQEAKVQQAAAGAANTKITVNTAEDYSKLAADNLKLTKEAAMGGIGTLNATSRIRRAFETGKVGSGPLSGPVNWVEKLTGTNKEGREQRQIVEQGLNQMILAARKKLAGSGAISDMETKLLAAADGGNINQLTDVEILAIVDAVESEAKRAIDIHNDQLDATKLQPGSENFIPAFQLPEEYRRDKPKSKVKAALRPARKGLPPKGAAPVKPKSNNPYSNLLPKPAGGL